MESPVTLVPSAEPTTIVKTEIDETEDNLRRMSLAGKSPVFGMRDSSSPDAMAMRRNQFASNESEDEIVPASFEEEPLNSSSQSSGSHSTKSSDTLERGFRDSDQHMNGQMGGWVGFGARLNSSSSRSSGSRSTKSSDTLERGFRVCDQHMIWPAACKECTKEQKKCKYHEEMDRPRANISVDTSQTSDSSGCEFCKECSNGQLCHAHRNQAHFKEALPPTPQFEFSRADQVDTDTE